MLNSAPVQLLPIDNGSGYKKTSENIKSAEPKERFENVFESVAKNEKSEFSDRDVKEVPREEEASRRKDSGKVIEKESVKQNTKTEVSKKTKKQKNEHNEEADVTAASAQHEVKTKSDVKKMLSGLSSEGVSKADFNNEAADAKNVKGLKLVETVKQKVLSVKKEALRGASKVSGETGAAGSSLAKMVFGKNDNSKHKLSVKSDENSKMLNIDAGTEKKAAADKGLIKASVQLVNAAAEGLNHSSKTDGSEKNSLKSAKKNSKLRVVDQRQAQSVENGKTAQKGTSAESGSFKSAIDAAGSDVELNPSADVLKSDSRTAETRTVQTSVLSQLKETINSQIVKQAGIVVKDNGTGEIKLVMKPENLGKVRIQLSLNDNHIAGRIIVENNIVREIFESNLENLYKAFGAEGFENGGLEVSVQGQGGDANGNGRRSHRGFNGRAVKVIDEAVPELADAEWQNNAVNMVV